MASIVWGGTLVVGDGSDGGVATSLRIDWQWKSETPTISKEQAPPLFFSSVIANSDLRWLEWIRKLQKRLYYSCRKFLGVLAKVFLRKVLLIPSKILKMLPAKQKRVFTHSQRIFSSCQPGQKNFSHLQKILNSFGQSGESFSNPLKEYFLPSASQGRKTFHTFKKY